jgi:hypothetical protein
MRGSGREIRQQSKWLILLAYARDQRLKIFSMLKLLPPSCPFPAHRNLSGTPTLPRIQRATLLSLLADQFFSAARASHSRRSSMPSIAMTRWWWVKVKLSNRLDNSKARATDARHAFALYRRVSRSPASSI